MTGAFRLLEFVRMRFFSCEGDMAVQTPPFRLHKKNKKLLVDVLVRIMWKEHGSVLNAGVLWSNMKRERIAIVVKVAHGRVGPLRIDNGSPGVK